MKLAVNRLLLLGAMSLQIQAASAVPPGVPAGIGNRAEESPLRSCFSVQPAGRSIAALISVSRSQVKPAGGAPRSSPKAVRLMTRNPASK